MMRAVATNGFHNLSPQDCTEVIDFIAAHADDRQLSLRLLTPSLRKLLYARSEGIDWQPMVKSQLRSLGQKNDASKRLDSRTKDLQLLRTAMQKFPDSVADQQAEFCRLSGKSRASFYRVLQRYRSEIGD
jgi:hypothetical protein